MIEVCNKIKWFVSVGCLLLALPGCWDDERADAAGQLLAAFGSACPSSNGQWTEAARSHSNRLIGVLESLKATDKCKGYESTLGEIQQLSDKIQWMFTRDKFRNYRAAQATIQELTLSLNDLKGTMDPNNPDTNDVALAEALNAAIIDNQVILAIARAERGVDETFEDKNRHVRATLTLSNRLQTLHSNIRGLSECLYQSPLAAVQIAGSLLALGGSYVNPVIGAGTAMAGQLLTIGVEYARQHKINESIWKAHAAQLPSALSCGLEAMSELYCQSNDAYELVKLQTEQISKGRKRDRDKKYHMLTKGLDILGRRMSVLLRWLNEVRNGGDPSDEFDAERLVNKWDKLFTVHKTNLRVRGVINKSRRLHDAEGDEDARRLRVLDGIKQVASMLGTSNSSGNPDGPFSEFEPSARIYACYLVRGVNGECPPPSDSGMSIDDYLKSLDGLMAEITLQKFRSNWVEIHRIVNRRVMVEFAQNVTVDEASSLTSAFEPNEANNASPYQVLLILKHYFTQFRDELEEEIKDPPKPVIEDDVPFNPRLKKHLEETIKLLSEVILILRNVDDNNGAEGSDLVEIFDKFKLYVGTSFIEDRIRKLIRWDIQRRVEKGEIPKDAAEIVIAAGGVIEDTLLGSGSYNLEGVELDLNQARSMTETNLEVLRNHFSNLLGYSVNLLRTQELRGPIPERPRHAILSGRILPGEDLINRPNGQMLGKLCTLLVATGVEWPDDVSWGVCESAILGSIYSDEDGSNTIKLKKLKKEADQQKLMDRMCTFHRFMRQSRLAEAVGRSNANSVGQFHYNFIGR